MSLIRQSTSDPATELRVFHRYILPLSTLIPGLILLWGTENQSPLPAIAVIVTGSILALLGLVCPPLIRALLRLAQFLSYLIGWTISGILILVLYFGVMLPVALALRVLRRQSPVSLRPDPSVSTYWEPAPPATVPESAFRQF
jgi:hypothetical protein